MIGWVENTNRTYDAKTVTTSISIKMNVWHGMAINETLQLADHIEEVHASPQSPSRFRKRVAGKEGPGLEVDFNVHRIEVARTRHFG